LADGFEIRSTEAGPFVSVLTLSGPVRNGAQDDLRAQLSAPGLASKRVIVDLTEATLYDSWPFPLLLEETHRFREAGGELVVVSGQNTTVEPFVHEVSLDDLRWCRTLDDALLELLGEVVERAGGPTEAAG
jgi:anti-anti-sigma regulatory factor